MSEAKVIGAINGYLGTKIDSIFSSLQRRVTEQWNDVDDFSTWTLINTINGGSIKLGQYGTGVNHALILTATDDDDAVVDNYGSGIKIVANEPFILNQFRTKYDLLNSARFEIIDANTKEQIFVIASTDYSYVVSNVIVPPGTYYMGVYSEDNDNAYTRWDNTSALTLPYAVNADVSVVAGYSDRSQDRSSFSESATQLYSVYDIDVSNFEDVGILTGTAESPLVSPTDLFRYDMLEYIISQNDGTYQVDVLDADDNVLISNAKNLEYLSTLPVTKLVKVKVTFNRPTDTDVSPELLGVAISYIE